MLSGQNVVVTKCCLKLKKLRKRYTQKWDVRKVENEDCKRTYQDQLLEQGRKENVNTYIGQEWEAIKNNILKITENTGGIRKQENRKLWITEDLINMTEERHKFKNTTKQEDQRQYKKLRNQLVEVLS